MSKPFLSVCIPVYNGQKFLRSAVESVSQQDFSDWEIIIGDNASNDATPEICRDLAASDSRIQTFRNPNNLGLSGNLNNLLGRAKGRWVGFLPADDEYLPGLFSELSRQTETSSSSLWICAHDSVHTTHTDTIRPFKDARQWEASSFARMLFLNGNLFGELSCFFCLNSAARKVDGGFGAESQTLDLRFWIHLALANPGSIVLYHPGVLVKAHQHEMSESSRYRRTSENWVELFRFFDEMSRLPWPKNVIIRQAIRATYCLVRHGHRLPANERLPSLYRVFETWRSVLNRTTPRPTDASMQ